MTEQRILLVLQMVLHCNYHLMRMLFFSPQWWNVVTGESLQTFYTNGTNLKKIHVSPDFKTYVTVDNLGILYVLQVLE